MKLKLGHSWLPLIATCWLLKVRGTGFGDPWPTPRSTARKPRLQFCSSGERPVYRHRDRSLRHTTDKPATVYRGFEVSTSHFMWLLESHKTPHCSLCGGHLESHKTPHCNLWGSSGTKTFPECQRLSYVFSSCVTALWIGNRRSNSSRTSHHRYNKTSALVLRIGAGTGVSYRFCWSSLCRAAKGGTASTYLLREVILQGWSETVQKGPLQSRHFACSKLNCKKRKGWRWDKISKVFWGSLQAVVDALLGFGNSGALCSPDLQ